jgi:DNA repair exonuclease SbcCD ATPase subunit
VRVKNVDELLNAGRGHEVKKIASLTTRIEDLLEDLKDRVDEWDAAKHEREEAERIKREAEERVERLKRELAEAQELLTGVKKKKSVQKKAVPKLNQGEHVEYPCPTCGKKDLYSPQARGAHRNKAHGFRKGDDEK